MRRLDRHGALAFAPIQDVRGQELLLGVPAELRLDSMHGVTPDGRVWSGGEAVRVILGALPFGTIPSAVAATFPEATDAAYRLVTRHRETLGRWLGRDACSVDPSGR